MNYGSCLEISSSSPKQFPAPRGSTTPRSGGEQLSWTLTSSARFVQTCKNFLVLKTFPLSESSPEKVTAASDLPRSHAWRLPGWLHQ